MKLKRLILVSCVIGLGFAGVSYAAWTDNLKINTLLTTGKVKVAFSDPVIQNDEAGGLKAEIDGDTLFIDGEVTVNTDILVKYTIDNNSTIPVKYEEDGEDIPDALALQQGDTILEPGESERNNALSIYFPEPGDYEFEQNLTFVQYNSKSGGGWKDTLKISIKVQVIEEVPVLPEPLLLEENPLIEEDPALDEIKDKTSDTVSGVDIAPIDDSDQSDGSDRPSAEIPQVSGQEERPSNDENSDEINPETNPETKSIDEKPEGENPASDGDSLN